MNISIPSLAHIAATSLAENDPTEYKTSEIGANLVTAELTIEESKGVNVPKYSFEAYLCFLSIPERNGECVHGASTTGRLVPLIPGDPLPPSELSTFQITRSRWSDNGQSPEENPIFITPQGKNPHDGVDMEFFVGSDSDSHEDDDYGWIHSSSAEQPTSQPGGTIADFQLFARDLLFADPNHYKDKILGQSAGGDEEEIAYDDLQPGSIEFLGNGCPALGSWYSRAAIILWPHSQQSLVREETIGGQREKEAEQARLRELAREKQKRKKQKTTHNSK